MKKASACLLILVILAALMIPVSAAETEGFSDLQVFNPNVTLQPMDTDDQVVSPDATGFYPNAVKLNLTYSGSVADGLYLGVLQAGEGVPTRTNVKFIDQYQAIGNSITFTLYPEEGTLTPGETINIYMSSNTEDLSTYQMVGSFKYTTGEAPEPPADEIALSVSSTSGSGLDQFSVVASIDNVSSAQNGQTAYVLLAVFNAQGQLTVSPALVPVVFSAAGNTATLTLDLSGAETQAKLLLVGADFAPLSDLATVRLP